MVARLREGRAATTALLLALLLGVGLLAWLGFSTPEAPATGGVAREAAAVLPKGAVRPGPVDGLAFASPDIPAADAPDTASIARTVASDASTGPRRFVGRVVAREGGRPVEGARVVLAHGDGEQRAETDPAGAFDMVWTAAGEPVLEVRAQGYVPARLPRLEPHAPGADPFIVRLVEGAGIEGVVLGPPSTGDGAPSVRLHRRSGRGGSGPELERSGVDARGTFLFDDLEAGEYIVVAEAPERVLAVATALVEPGERAQVMLELSRAGRLAGLVLDDGDRPIEGVRVRLENRRQGVASNVEAASRREAVTGSDGRFLLVGLAAGTNRVELRSPWGDDRNEDITLARAGEEESRTFRLRSPAILSGRVLDADGRPVPGAQVEIAWGQRVPPLVENRNASAPRGGTSSVRTEADAQGRFRLENLRVGETGVLVAMPADAADGRMALELGVQLTAGEERADVELVLAPALRFGGTVSMESGGPLADARVELAARVRGRTRIEPLRVETDLEGRFVFESVPPARYRLTVRHADARTRAEWVDLESSRDDYLLELEGALRLEGVVLDDFGLAVADAAVSAVRVDVLEQDPDRRERRWDRTDDYGRFDFSELEAGLYELTAYATGYESLGGPVNARLPNTGEVLLEMRRNAVPLPASVHGRVELMGSGDPPVGFEVRGVRNGILFYEDGRFRLEGIRPGTHRLELAAESCIPLDLGTHELAAGARLDLGTLELEIGTLLRIEVKDEDGERLRGARVTLRPLPVPEGGRAGAAPQRIRERDRGRFDARVARANWRLTVSAPGMKNESRRLEVRPIEFQRVEVVLEREAQ